MNFSPDVLPRLIPEELAARSVSLDAIGFSSPGWSRADALQVLAALGPGSIGVLGGDVIRLENEKLRNTPDSWYSERRTGESRAEFAARSIRHAENYIQRYPDPDNGTVLYVFVFGGGA